MIIKTRKCWGCNFSHQGFILSTLQRWQDCCIVHTIHTFEILEEEWLENIHHNHKKNTIVHHIWSILICNKTTFIGDTVPTFMWLMLIFSTNQGSRKITYIDIYWYQDQEKVGWWKHEGWTLWKCFRPDNRGRLLILLMQQNICKCVCNIV